MAYLTNLKWWNGSRDYSDEQRKILLALSDERYKWRTEERLEAVTGLDSTIVKSTLLELVNKGLIRPSFSKKRNIIYGLKERVG